MITVNGHDIIDIDIDSTDVVRITDYYTGDIVWQKNIEPEPDPNEYFYIENRYNGTNRLIIQTYGSAPSGKFATSVEYSKDKSTWTSLNINNSASSGIDIYAGEKVYFRNNSKTWNYYSIDEGYYYRHMFYCNQSFAVGGNIITLADYTGTISNYNSGLFAYTLASCENLISSYSLYLPTPMCDLCYTGLFSADIGLTTTVSTLHSTLTKYCYSNMYVNCYSLEEAPVLPATSLEYGCYNEMFSHCTSLTDAPSLQATTLEERCYRYMFYGCTGLTTTPSLPATTLVVRCYDNMFADCTNLNNVITSASSISAANCLDDWLNNVAATGTFHKLGSASFPSGSSGVPSGWIIVNS